MDVLEIDVLDVIAVGLQHENQLQQNGHSMRTIANQRGHGRNAAYLVGEGGAARRTCVDLGFDAMLFVATSLCDAPTV
jgi:hypothetical protein